MWTVASLESWLFTRKRDPRRSAGAPCVLLSFDSVEHNGEIVSDISQACPVSHTESCLSSFAPALLYVHQALQRGMFSSMFSSMKKEEEAAENFKIAGQNYKLAKDYVSSVEMYKTAAENYAIAERALDEMQCYDEMASSAKAGELFDSCVEAVTKIIGIYQDNGKSDRVPKKYLFLADLYHDAEKFGDEADFLELASDAAEAENQDKFAQTQQLRRAKILLHHVRAR